uniref:Rhodanese domain-containing protein n=1 Tax=Oryzias sinensis TaxID=183150 RepID=A0A8C7ZAG1_9TELE
MDISYEDLQVLLKENQNLVLVDVRSKGEVDNGHIPGSINIPLDTVESAFKLPPEDFKSKYGKTKPEKDSEDLVFHCQMGRRGETATKQGSKLCWRLHGVVQKTKKMIYFLFFYEEPLE